MDVKSIHKLHPVISLNRYIHSIIPFIRPEELYDQEECRLIDDEVWCFSRENLGYEDQALGSHRELNRLLDILSDFRLIDLNPTDPTDFSMSKLL